MCAIPVGDKCACSWMLQCMLFPVLPPQRGAALLAARARNQINGTDAFITCCQKCPSVTRIDGMATRREGCVCVCAGCTLGHEVGSVSVERPYSALDLDTAFVAVHASVWRECHCSPESGLPRFLQGPCSCFVPTLPPGDDCSATSAGR